MNTKQLLFAIRLAETLHFGKAAEIENIAQSGFSAQIRKLEGELGFTIFNRTSHRVELTEAGVSFIDHAQSMLSDMNNAIFECRAIQDRGNGVLKVGFFGEAAGELTHLIFSLYKRLNPDIKLFFSELRMTNQVEAILTGEVDAAFIRLPIDDERLDYQIMYDEPRVAVVPISHELAEAGMLHISDLHSQPFALANEGTPIAWNSYWSLSEQFNEPSRLGALVNSIPESLAAVAYNGVFDTYPLSATRIYTHPCVRYIQLQDAPRSAISLVTKKGNTSQALRQFKRCVSIVLSDSLSLLPDARQIKI